MDIGYDTLAIGLVIWNLFTFLIMGLDKRKAMKQRRRVSESTLLGLAFLLGAPGVLAAMLAFRHKTRKALFIILVPLAIIVNILMVVGLVNLL